MTIYKEKIVNALTGEETFRDYTEAEIAEVEQWEAEHLAAEEQARLDAEAKAAAKAAVLAKLGLTEEEINAFLA